MDENLRIRRLAVFERVKARIASSGYAMKEDTVFLELITLWTEGRVELDEVVDSYVRLRSGIIPQRSLKPLAETAPVQEGELDLMADLQRVIGMVDIQTSKSE